MLVLVLVLVLVFTLDFPQDCPVDCPQDCPRFVPVTVHVTFRGTKFPNGEYKRFCLYQKILSVIRIFERVIGKMPIFACKLERVSG